MANDQKTTGIMLDTTTIIGINDNA